MNDDLHRSLRSRSAAKYRPAQISLLLVAEAPPSASDRYFYYSDVATQDSLFRYVARGILGVDPTRSNKAELLGQLQARGVYLIDLCEDPVDRNADLEACVPDLVRRARESAPDHVILIKTSVYDAAYAALAEAGLPVVDERIPFPGTGQQRRFEESFMRAMKAIRWRRGPA